MRRFSQASSYLIRSLSALEQLPQGQLSSPGQQTQRDWTFILLDPGFLAWQVDLYSSREAVLKCLT